MCYKAVISIKLSHNSFDVNPEEAINVVTIFQGQQHLVRHENDVSDSDFLSDFYFILVQHSAPPLPRNLLIFCLITYDLHQYNYILVSK